MALLNNCTFVGNLTKDGEFKITPEGKEIYTINLALFKGYKRDAQGNPIMENGYKAKETEYITITAFDQVAKALVDTKDDHLAKGAKIIVSCKFNGVRTYKNKHEQIVPVADFLLETTYNVDVLAKSKHGRSSANNGAGQQVNNGQGGQQGYNQGGQQGYNQGGQQGYNQGGQQGYNQGYGNQGYNQGFGNNNNLPFE